MKIVEPDTAYKSDAGLFYSCRYHVVICPKYRRKVLNGNIAERLREIILEGQSDSGYRILELEIMPDHIHILMDVNPRIGIFSQICSIKGRTSRVLRAEFPELKSKLPCLWTRSSFICSVGSLDTQDINSYLEGQKHV